MAFAGRTRAVFHVWRLGHGVTWSGLVRAANITGHLSFAATFSRALKRRNFCSELLPYIFAREQNWKRFNSNEMLEPEQGESYLCPLCYLPLWTAGGTLARSSLHGSLQVGHGAEVAVDRAVEAWREHLPAANLAKLETLSAGPGALAPAARLPSRRTH